MNMRIRRPETRPPRTGKQLVQRLPRNGDKTMRLQTGLNAGVDQPCHLVFRIDAGDRDTIDAGERFGNAFRDDPGEIGKRIRADHPYFDLPESGPDTLVVAQLITEFHPFPVLCCLSLVHSLAPPVTAPPRPAIRS